MKKTRVVTSRGDEVAGRPNRALGCGSIRRKVARESGRVCPKKTNSAKKLVENGGRLVGDKRCLKREKIPSAYGSHGGSKGMGVLGTCPQP